MTAAVPDPHFRDQLAEELRATILHALLNEAPVWEIEFAAGPGLAVGVADAALVAARAVVARVQAATNQRAAEETEHGPGKCVSVVDANRVLADARRGVEHFAALASPAPAPRAEAGR